MFWLWLVSVVIYEPCYYTHYPGYLSVDRLLNFTIGLTDHHPTIGNGPLNYPFLKCATHGAMGDVPTVNLTCESPLYARRRYLFVVATVSDYFNLAEVEVFDGKLMQ